MKIVADAHLPYIKEYFSAYGDLILKPGRAISRKDVIDADILLVRSITQVDKNLLDKTRVKFVGSVTAGADHLDTKWLDEVGVSWSVANGFNASPVADYVVSTIAALQKQKLLMQPTVKVGVIGIGNVGRLVVERLRLLNFEVLMCDPLRAEKEKKFNSVFIEELVDLDLVTLHVPLIHSGKYPTTHFINQDFLQRQRDGCVLLNTSRGAVINSKMLLQHGAHLHWCFDVWEQEPNINKMILERSLIATPHIAGYSVQSKIRGMDMIYKIACAQQIIQAQLITPVEIPQQQIVFSGHKQCWQDVVLDIFNPLAMTAAMRGTLLPAKEYGVLFDEMRNNFNYRHEFKFTKVSAEGLSADDKRILSQLGVTIS